MKVAIVHGKMKAADKQTVMASFAAGETQVLVSTTVIEVGVDVPNATLMVIEDADRFGLSQLHQLRGRVGRGKAKSYCILTSHNKNPETQQRLKALCKTTDGFRIADEDLLVMPGCEYEVIREIRALVEWFDGSLSNVALEAITFTD